MWPVCILSITQVSDSQYDNEERREAWLSLSANSPDPSLAGLTLRPTLTPALHDRYVISQTEGNIYITQWTILRWDSPWNAAHLWGERVTIEKSSKSFLASKRALNLHLPFGHPEPVRDHIEKKSRPIYIYLYGQEDRLEMLPVSVYKLQRSHQNFAQVTCGRWDNQTLELRPSAADISDLSQYCLMSTVGQHDSSQIEQVMG